MGEWLVASPDLGEYGGAFGVLGSIDCLLQPSNALGKGGMVGIMSSSIPAPTLEMQ